MTGQPFLFILWQSDFPLNYWRDSVIGRSYPWAPCENLCGALSHDWQAPFTEYIPAGVLFLAATVREEKGKSRCSDEASTSLPMCSILLSPPVSQLHFSCCARGQMVLEQRGQWFGSTILVLTLAVVMVPWGECCGFSIWARDVPVFPFTAWWPRELVSLLNHTWIF